MNSIPNDKAEKAVSSNTNLRIWLERLGPLLALVLVTIGFAIADRVWGQGRFIEFRNVRVILVGTAPVAVAALGMTLIIMTGGIDLSAGTASVLCTTVLACTLNADFPVTLAVLAAISTGGCLRGSQWPVHRHPSHPSLYCDAGIDDHLFGDGQAFRQ